MKLKFWEKPIETKSNVTGAFGTTKELGDFLIFGTPGSAATPASALSLYTKSTAVSIPINLIAESFASIDPVLEDIDGKIITESPVLDLLSEPSPYYDSMLFMEAIAKNYLVTGECGIVAIGSINRPPLELQPISPSNISVVEGNGGLATSIIVSGTTLVGTYLLIVNKNRARYLLGSLKEIYQIRNFNVDDNSLLRGMSNLKAASAEARQHIEGNNHNVSLLTNGGRVFVVFHTSSDLNPDDFEAFKERVHSQYGGTSNAGKIGVTSGGDLDIKNLGSSNKDMDFANLQAVAKESIALQYKVPLALVTTDATTFNNYAESKLALYDDATLPLADKMFSGLSKFLLPRFGLDPSKVKITYDKDSITALEKRRNENLKLRKELNIETTNELRAGTGLDDINGGDNIFIPANSIPIDSDLFVNDGETSTIEDNSDVDVELARGG